MVSCAVTDLSFLMKLDPPCWCVYIFNINATSRRLRHADQAHVRAIMIAVLIATRSPGHSNEGSPKGFFLLIYSTDIPRQETFVSSLHIPQLPAWLLGRRNQTKPNQTGVGRR